MNNTSKSPELFGDEKPDTIKNLNYIEEFLICGVFYVFKTARPNNILHCVHKKTKNLKKGTLTGKTLVNNTTPCMSVCKLSYTSCSTVRCSWDVNKKLLFGSAAKHVVLIMLLLKIHYIPASYELDKT